MNRLVNMVGYSYSVECYIQGLSISLQNGGRPMIWYELIEFYQRYAPCE